MLFEQNIASNVTRNTTLEHAQALYYENIDTF